MLRQVVVSAQLSHSESGARRRLVVGVLAALSLLLSLSAAAPETHTVSIKDLAFRPASLVVSPGDTVRWSNEDTSDHTVSATDGSFSSGNIAPGESFSHRFRSVGEFAYVCSLHPRMKGTVKVEQK